MHCRTAFPEKVRGKERGRAQGTVPCADKIQQKNSCSGGFPRPPFGNSSNTQNRLPVLRAM